MKMWKCENVKIWKYEKEFERIKKNEKGKEKKRNEKRKMKKS